MAQRKSKIYNLINNPFVYQIIQKLMSGTSFRNNIVKKNIKKTKLKILDIGCGPAEILEHIPKCEYYGYDIDKRSITYAKNKYKKKNFHFFCKKFEKSDLKKLPKFDVIIFFGILHHLNNLEVDNLLSLCKKKMRKKFKIIDRRSYFG